VWGILAGKPCKKYPTPQVIEMIQKWDKIA
jgi:hypothetical protein